MTKKLLSVFACVLIAITTCFSFAACGGNSGGNTPTPPSHDSTKWFTEKELAAKGLSGLTAPVNLTGKMQSSDYWFNDGYSFHQPCPNEYVFYENAKTYFDYFKTNYDGLFGKTSITALSLETDETWYNITQKINIDEYFSDNPSKLYKFYYVTNNTLEDGYIVKGSVFTFEIRYEFSTNDNCYLFKLFIESADTNHNGTSRNYYKMK